MDALGNLWRYLTDIIDILIVSYVFYKVITLIRGTRAILLVQGILVIVVAWVISTILNLRTLEWLMTQAFTYGVLVLMIIFQPELRRALEQLGRGRFFRRAVEKEVQDSEEWARILSRAAVHLGARRIGALIVLERKIGLGEYIETGIPIQAKLSTELLINIFTPNTPLHDGAVIIRGDTIMAAGCYLPLSENPFISKELGTRHRAAIGISELGDSLSLVVSEETGQISICQEGAIERDLGQSELEERLRRFYQEDRPYTPWRKGRRDADGQMGQ